MDSSAEAFADQCFEIVRRDWVQRRVSKLVQRFLSELYKTDYKQRCQWQKTGENRYVFRGMEWTFRQLPQEPTLLDDLGELRDLKYKYSSANDRFRGEFAHHKLTLSHPKKSVIQLVIECDGPLPDWRDDFVSNILGNGKITPVLHTPSLIKREDGTYEEVWDRSHLGGREFFDLTGHGEAEALRQLAVFCARTSRRLEPSVTPRMIDVQKALTNGNVVWFGSCFNPLHGLRELLDSKDLWGSNAPSCVLEGFPNKVEVSYPGGPKRITNTWPPTEPEHSFSLVRSIQSIYGTRITIAGGTDTGATLLAARSLLGVEKEDLNRLVQIQKLADAGDQFEVLFETTAGRLSPKTRLIWPKPKAGEENGPDQSTRARQLLTVTRQV